MYDIHKPLINAALQSVFVLHDSGKHTWKTKFSRASVTVVLMTCFTAVTSMAQNAGDFTIIVLPDTQFYYSAYGNVIGGSGSATFFQQQTQWIAANKTALNIQAVLGVGDIVNQADRNLSPNQWPEANSAVATLDTAGIPYLFPVGNHDYVPTDNIAGRTAALTNFNSYFGPARYASYNWYGGQFPAGSNENFYAIVNIGGKEYLLLALETYPRDISLDWARQVLQNNSDAEVIITTHSMEYWDNHRVGVCDNFSLPTYGLKYDNEGERMWYSFIREFSNISLVLNGHFIDMPGGTPTGEAVGHSADVGLKGNLVNQMMADYQDITNGGDGYLRILTFSPSQNTIAVRTYSPFLNSYLTDPQNQFTVPWHGPATQPSGTATINGLLTDDSCHPLANVPITLNGATSTNTDASGHFLMSVTAPGTYAVRSFVSGVGGAQQVVTSAAGYPTYMKIYITGGSASVSGTVTTGGAPVGGAIVSFSAGSAVTNATGSYQVPYVPGGDFIFSATAPGFSVASQTVHVVSGNILSGINFEVAPSTTATGTVTGTVSGASGPVGGALVSYSGGSATTDVGGNYTLANVPAGTVTVTASATGYQSRSQSVSVTAGATATSNFSLSIATGTITGTVKNSAGTAISGAAVSYSGGSTTTDAAGNYTISNVLAGTITVTASATGYQSSSQSVLVTAGATTTANFTLTLTGTITGTVKTSAGAAITGAVVSYSGGSTTTDVAGNYTLSSVPAGTVTVTASATGYQSSSQSVSVTAGATATANFSLSIATGTITGTVKNSAGTAISGAAVSYSGGSTTTDAAGSYTLTNVPAGTVVVSVMAAGYVTATQSLAVNLNTTTIANFTLTTLPPGSITGTVKNDSGAAINAATVSYTGGSAQTNSNGVYTLSQVPVGSVSLSASAPAYLTSTQTVVVNSNSATTANFTLLSTTGTITGTVTSKTTGSAIGAATIQISGGTSTTTNAQGIYTFTKLIPGTYTLAASATSYQQSTNSAAVSSGATSTLNFSLNPLASMAGTVTNSVTGASIGNATIQITGGGSSKTNGGGAYSINNISIDNPTVLVTAAANGYLSVTVSAPVSSGATTTQNFALTPSMGTLSGTVLNSAGNPINGATVSYSGGSAKTNSKGVYTLKNVPDGAVSVSVSAHGYQTITQNVTISGGVTTTANFTLQ